MIVTGEPLAGFTASLTLSAERRRWRNAALAIDAAAEVFRRDRRRSFRPGDGRQHRDGGAERDREETRRRLRILITNKDAAAPGSFPALESHRRD